jgi:hypothetical protein
MILNNNLVILKANYAQLESETAMMIFLMNLVQFKEIINTSMAR